MKRAIIILLTVTLGLSLLVPFHSFAEELPAPPPTEVTTAPGETAPPDETPSEETTSPPAPDLTAVTFSGAEIDGPFHSDVFEYKLIITDHNADIRLESYKCPDYNAMVQVDYLTNTSGDARGLVVRVSNSSGVNEYKFLFNTIKEIKKTPDASLMSLTFDYGELSPGFHAEVYKYTLYLPSDLEVLNINAVPSDENAKINTPNQITLNQNQTSPISIKVTSGDGTNTLTYKLNIKRVNKTIAQIKAEMEDPEFTSFVEIPFYQTALFYVVLGVGMFLIALSFVLYFTLRKKKTATPDANALVPTTKEIPATAPAEAMPEAAKSDETTAHEQVAAQTAKPLPAAVGTPAPAPKEDALPEPDESQITLPHEALPQEEPSQRIPVTPEPASKQEVIALSKKQKYLRKKRVSLFGKKNHTVPAQADPQQDQSDLEPQQGNLLTDKTLFEKNTPPCAADTSTAVSDRPDEQTKPLADEQEPTAVAYRYPAQTHPGQKQQKPEQNRTTSSEDWLDLDKYKKYK